jgi:hypothetical protein
MQSLPREIQAKIAMMLLRDNVHIFGQDFSIDTKLGGTCRQQTQIMLEVAQQVHARVLPCEPCLPEDCLYALAATCDDYAHPFEGRDARTRISDWRRDMRQSRRMLTRSLTKTKMPKQD